MSTNLPAVQTLHTIAGPISVELPSVIADDIEGSLEFLANAGQSMKFAAAMSVFFRVMMGLQLLRVQEKALWQHFEIVDRKGQRVNEANLTWSKFLAFGFPLVAGYSRETAYHAIQLAECTVIASLPPAQLQGFESLANAVELARIERRHGPAIAREFLEPAMTLPVEAFRALAGKGKTSKMEVLLEDPATAEPLGRIMNWLKRADPDALQTLWEVLEAAKLRAGDNPTDTVDCVIACCRFQWAQEQENE